MISNLQKTINWYDSHAEEYSKKIKAKSPISEIEKFVEYLPKGALVLDAGCAAGRDSEHLHDFGLSTIGIDLSSKLIKIAKANYPQLEFIEGDLLSLPFTDNKFTGVWASASLVHLENEKQLKKALLELKRVLKDEGVLYLSMQNRGDQPSGWVDDYHSREGRFFQFISFEDLTKLVKAEGFEILSSFKRESSRPEIEWSVFYLKK